MLTQVDVYGTYESIPPLELPLFGADEEVIQVKGVDGLGPVKANISSSPYGVVSGEAITGTSVGKRNVVLSLGLNPDWETQTIDELRKLLYKYFMPEADVTLRFTTTHLPLCQIDGVVESLEPNIFAKDPEIQVSVICPRPDFTALDQTVLTGVVTDDDTDLVEIDYVGSAKTGLHILVESSPARGAYTGEVRLVFNSGSFVLEDLSIDDLHSLELNSVPGFKYIREPEGSVNLLGRVQNGYTWPVLQAGINQFAVVADLPGQVWSLSYFAKFGGL